MDIYDAAANTWTTAHLSQARDKLVAASVGSKILFAGGRYSDGTTDMWHSSDAVDIYDVDTGQWATAQLSQARRFMAATTLGHKVFFAGGSAGGNGAVGDIVDIYDADTNSWSTDRLSVSRWGLAATTVGNLAIFAGGQAVAGASDAVDIHNGDTGQWSTRTLFQARGVLAAATVGDAALFAGGSDGDLVTYDTVDIFTVPEPATLALLALGGLAMMRRRRK